jgi:hypothetical protein
MSCAIDGYGLFVWWVWCLWTCRRVHFYHILYTVTVCPYLSTFSSDVVGESTIMLVGVTWTHPSSFCIIRMVGCVRLFFICRMWNKVGCSSSRRSVSLLSNITICSLVLCSCTMFALERFYNSSLSPWGERFCARTLYTFS